MSVTCVDDSEIPDGDELTCNWAIAAQANGLPFGRQRNLRQFGVRHASGWRWPDSYNRTRLAPAAPL